VPRISALLMLRSTISAVSAPATCPFRGSITNPTQLLCTEELDSRKRKNHEDLIQILERIGL
jgi:hypothetical protein